MEILKKTVMGRVSVKGNYSESMMVKDRYEFYTEEHP